MIAAYFVDQNAWWKPVVTSNPPPAVGETIFIYCPWDDEEFGDAYGYLVQVTAVERNWSDTHWIVKHNVKEQLDDYSIHQ